MLIPENEPGKFLGFYGQDILHSIKILMATMLSWIVRITLLMTYSAHDVWSPEFFVTRYGGLCWLRRVSCVSCVHWQKSCHHIAATYASCLHMSGFVPRVLISGDLKNIHVCDISYVSVSHITRQLLFSETPWAIDWNFRSQLIYRCFWCLGFYSCIIWQRFYITLVAMVIILPVISIRSRDMPFKETWYCIFDPSEFYKIYVATSELWFVPD